MKQEILHIMPIRLRPSIGPCLNGAEDVEEIRIRIGQPPELRCNKRSLWLSERITAEDVEEMITFISRYSIYAYEEEIRQGFLTIAGGHRVGFAGQVRIERGQVSQMTNIRFLNIRIAREHKGCGKKLLHWLYDEEGDFLNTLLISKPGIGKTTYLRDCIRLVSNGDEKRDGKKICVIDERSELAACHLGIPQNDMGKRTDVLDGCPKGEGMRMALRSMSPEIIAVDELGGREDAIAVGEMILCGCGILGTMHGETLEHILAMDEMKQIHQKKLFQRYIFLKRNPDGERVATVYNQERERLC